jgi:hypothetical protein
MTYLELLEVLSNLDDYSLEKVVCLHADDDLFPLKWFDNGQHDVGLVDNLDTGVDEQGYKL